MRHDREEKETRSSLMAIFKIPVVKQVPAYAEVEVEADTLEEACIQLRDEIKRDGLGSRAAEADFTADWEEAYDLTLADVILPDGRNFSAKE